MIYSKPHFLDCTCQCGHKRLRLQAILNSFNKLSISKRTFLLIHHGVGGEQGRPSHEIQYDEYQWIGAPTPTSLIGRFKGNIGDIYIDKTPESYALYAKTSPVEWKKWPGPLSITNALRHPLYYHYVLWCHPSTRTIGWFFDLLVNKAYHGGNAHDIIYAILEERREAEASPPHWNKQSAKRKVYPSEGQEATPRKKLKWTTKPSYNDSPVVTTKLLTPLTVSIDPTSDPLEKLACLRGDNIRLRNAHIALQKMITTHPMPSLLSDVPVSSQINMSNLLESQRKSPHSSISSGGIITSQLGLQSNFPKPLESDVPLSPSPQRVSDVHDEGDCCNLTNNPSNTAHDTAKPMEVVLTALDPQKEANVGASSSVNVADVINHNTFNESVMAHDDVLDTYEYNLLAGKETGIDLPSNDDLITPSQPDDHCDIDTDNFVDNTARGCILPSKPLEEEENVGGIPVEENHDTTRTDLDLRSDEAPVTMAVVSDPEKELHMTCNSQPTTPDHVIVKDVISTLSEEQNFKFRLNCSLKEIIFHVTNSELICRLCLGAESSSIRGFSMDVSLDDLGDHCVKEHLQFCEVLTELSAEELGGLKQRFSN